MILGDFVEHRKWPEYGVGVAAHSDLQGRWVAWKPKTGHWGAGVYAPSDLAFVVSPESSQLLLQI